MAELEIVDAGLICTIKRFIEKRILKLSVDCSFAMGHSGKIADDLAVNTLVFHGRRCAEASGMAAERLEDFMKRLLKATPGDPT